MGGGGLVGPAAGADVLVERVGREVGAVGPDVGSGFGVDVGEAGWGARVVEHRSSHMAAACCLGANQACACGGG